MTRLIAPAMLALVLGACDSHAPSETAEFRVVEQINNMPNFPLLSNDAPPPILVPTTGTLVRDGQCLFLDGPQGRALILWRAGSRLGQEGDALVVREGPTAARDPAPTLVVGNEITGAGGVQTLTREQISRIAEPDPPESCGLRVVPLSMIEPGRPRTYQVDPPRRAVAIASSPPPPPPPPPPSLTERAKEGGVPIVASTVVRGFANPRTALLAHLVDYYRDREGYRGLPICIDAVGAQFEVLKRRYPLLNAKDACEWRDGLVVRRDSGVTAMMLHAQVDCSGGACSGEGGYAIGNLGAASSAFRLVRRGNGWLIQKLGLEIIS